MGRPQRIDTPGGWYHVFNRGAAQQTIFRDDRDRVEFERLLGEAHDRVEMVVHAYCLMTNHFHLLLEFPVGGISDAMHLVGSQYVRHHNGRAGRDGPLFRERFRAKPVVDDGYLLTLVGYIHRNPLAFLEASELRSFRWSSLRILFGDRRSPRWMDVERTLDVIGGVDALRQLVDEGPGIAPTCAEVWECAIDTAVAISPDASTLPHATRTVAVLLADRLGESAGPELADLVTFPTSQARRSALSRARRRLRDHPFLASVVDDVIALVA